MSRVKGSGGSVLRRHWQVLAAGISRICWQGWRKKRVQPLHSKSNQLGQEQVAMVRQLDSKYIRRTVAKTIFLSVLVRAAVSP
jgi:hypothetical protein